ncbi:MAG: NAD(P)H-dependent oxidoreductase [Devosiaceae bacterium]|nr:NAD(P)H-dependent oxidoreductase [Devosiaceae bacterium MH13]
MKALIVYCHPSAGSFNHAVLETILTELRSQAIEHRVIDLYAERFDPCMSLDDWTEYEDTSCNTSRIAQHVESLRWCDSLVFVYPTWWFGQPATLKGWLDRVLVPGVAFNMPTDETPRITHSLRHINRLGVFTTCGASFWLTKAIGSPGKRVLMRGLRTCLATRAKTAFAAHYLMDSSTERSRARHLERVRTKTRKLFGIPARKPGMVGGYPEKVEQTA